jgi:hypothetical protein
VVVLASGGSTYGSQRPLVSEKLHAEALALKESGVTMPYRSAAEARRIDDV